MSEINWQTFIKDSLIITIVGIIYLLITINSIVLVKIFPNTPSDNALNRGKPYFRNQSILDYLFPTDLTCPPYGSQKNCESAQMLYSVEKADERKGAQEGVSDVQKGINDGEPIKKFEQGITDSEPVKKQGGGKYDLRGGVAENNHACAYQISMKDWAGKIKQWMGADHIHYSESLEWPYSWLVPYDGDSNWEMWYFKFKMANIMINQQWYARTLIKFLCDQEFWLMIPDWILFMAFPFSKSLSSNSLLPILPTIIYFWTTFVVGPVLAIISLASFFWEFFPPGDVPGTEFTCEQSIVTKDKIQQSQGQGKLQSLKNFIKKARSGCGPGFLGNLGMLIVMVLSGFLCLITIGWYSKPPSWLDLKTDNWFLSPIFKFIDWLGGWFILFLIILSFALFMRCGGFLLLFAAGSMTIVWITTIIKTLAPFITSPESVLEVFGCNKDLIALLLTAIITLRAQQEQLLPSTVTNTMWGVWGILLLVKVLLSIQKVLTK